MPDPTDALAAAPAAAPEGAPVAAAPVETAPVAAPVAPEAAAAPESAPPVAEAPAPEGEAAPVGEAAPEASGEVEAKPEETPEKPDETALSAQPAETAQPEPFKYEAWKLPEGAELPPEVSAAATNLFGKYGLSQEASQELVDFHFAQMKRAQDAMAQHQHDVFADTRRKWRGEFEKAAGNRRNTVLTEAKHAIAEAVPEKQRGAFWDVLNMTGAGDHPAVINAFAALGRRLREPRAPQPGMPANQPTSAAERRYGRQR